MQRYLFEDPSANAALVLGLGFALPLRSAAVPVELRRRQRLQVDVSA